MQLEASEEGAAALEAKHAESLKEARSLASDLAASRKREDESTRQLKHLEDKLGKQTRDAEAAAAKAEQDKEAAAAKAVKALDEEQRKVAAARARRTAFARRRWPLKERQAREREQQATASEIKRLEETLRSTQQAKQTLIEELSAIVRDAAADKSAALEAAKKEAAEAVEEVKRAEPAAVAAAKAGGRKGEEGERRDGRRGGAQREGRPRIR